MENQHRNLTTFLSGIVIYTLIYSYMGSFVRGCDNLFLIHLFQNLWYIMIADAFAMGVLYKNFYNRTIFSEIHETIGDLYKDTIHHGLNTKLPNEPNIQENNYQTHDVLENDKVDEEEEDYAKDSVLNSQHIPH